MLGVLCDRNRAQEEGRTCCSGEPEPVTTHPSTPVSWIWPHDSAVPISSGRRPVQMREHTASSIFLSSLGRASFENYSTSSFQPWVRISFCRNEEQEASLPSTRDPRLKEICGHLSSERSVNGDSTRGQTHGSRGKALRRYSGIAPRPAASIIT